MTQQEKLNDIVNAFVVHETKDIYIYNPKLNETTKEFLQSLQCDSGISFELSYKIANNATQLFYGLKLEELESEDLNELAQDTASVYTVERLNWIDLNNKGEIEDIMQEYNCKEIDTASAIWFELKTVELAEEIKDFILK